MNNLNRRTLITSALMSPFFGISLIKSAYSQEPLNREQLLEIVTSQRARTHLFLRIDFLIEALQAYLFRVEELESYDDLKTMANEEEAEISASLNGWLTRLYRGQFSQKLDQALSADDADERIEAAIERAEDLVANVASVLEDEGIPVEGRAGGEALQAIYTVEQVAALLGTAGDELYICRFFPFSKFCR